MGYLTDKYTQIIKLPFYLRWKAKRFGYQEIRKVRTLYYYVDKLIPELVHEHKVREAIHKQGKAVQYAKEAEEGGFKLSIQVFFQIEQILSKLVEFEEKWKKAESRIEKDLERSHHAELGRKLAILDQEFKQHFKAEIKKAAGEGREDYQRLLNIISDASKAGNGEDFMVKMRTALAANPNLMTALAIRHELNVLSKEQTALIRDEKELLRVLGSVEHYARELLHPQKKQGKELAEIQQKFVELDQDIKRLAQHMACLFRDFYVVLLRDFNIILTIEKYIDTFWQELSYFAKTKVMPGQVEFEKMKNLEEVKKDIGKRAHEVAQAFRIVHSEEESVASKA